MQCPPEQADALVYFTLDTEYLHSHEDENYLYYIAKTDNEYKIYDYDQQKIITLVFFCASFRCAFYLKALCLLLKPGSLFLLFLKLALSLF